MFATVAFGERWLYRNLGISGAYALWTLLFVVLGSVALNPLAAVSWLRFTALFSLSFVVYGASWTVIFFLVRGWSGEIVASVVAPVLLAVCLVLGLRHPSALTRAIVGTVIGNLTGYFLGRIAWQWLPPPYGMLLWGVIFGACLGAGLGHALYWSGAQQRG